MYLSIQQQPNNYPPTNPQENVYNPQNQYYKQYLQHNTQVPFNFPATISVETSISNKNTSSKQ